MTESNLPATSRGRGLAVDEVHQFVSITVGGQAFGIPVLLVHDVLGQQRITRIPLAPPEVAGSLNLRGRIVTAVHVRRRLGLEPLAADAETMSVVVEHQAELYSLIVDAVGEVLTLYDRDFENHPPTMRAEVRAVSNGIYRLDDSLLVMLDVPSLLDFVHVEAA